MRLKGVRTFIFSAICILAGIAATLLMVIDASMVEVFLPEAYRPFAPLVVTILGLISGWLRMITNTPPLQADPLPPLPPIPPLEPPK